MSVDTAVMQPVVDTLNAHINYEFTLNDRCDADDGFKSNNGNGVAVAEQAYHRWTKGSKEIFLCNHHNNLHDLVLAAQGWDVQHHPLHDQLDKPLDINHIGE